MTTTVQTLVPRTRRGVELALLLLAIGIVLLAWVEVDLGVRETVPAQLVTVGGGLLALSIAFHLVLRWKASYADPVLLPIATLLNGFGLVMIHRIDLAQGNDGISSNAGRQLVWTGLAVVIAAAVIIVLRDHRLLQRKTFTAMALGLVLVLLPLVPGLGTTVFGARIWIRVGPLSFQPGEVAKLALTVFFAGYLVQARDVLSLAGRKVVGFTLPGGETSGPSSWPGWSPSSCSSSRRTSGRRCSSSASSSACSTSPPSARAGSRSACCSSRAGPTWPTGSSGTCRSGWACGSTPSPPPRSSSPTSWPRA